MNSIERGRLAIRVHRKEMSRRQLNIVNELRHVECDRCRKRLAGLNLSNNVPLIGVEEALSLMVETALSEMCKLEILREEVLSRDGKLLDLPRLCNEIVPRQVGCEILVWG